MSEITHEKTTFCLTKESESFLRETAKWAYFLSIMGFILIGLMVLLAFFIGSVFSTLDSLGGGAMAMAGSAFGGTLTVLYLIFAVIYFFPVYYLYQFSSKAKAAFASDDNDQLSASFEYLKSHYKFLGVFTLVMLVIYALVFLISIIAGLAG